MCAVPKNSGTRDAVVIFLIVRVSSALTIGGRRSLEAAKRGLAIVRDKFDTCPFATKPFAYLAGNAASGERIYNQVTRISKHPNKVLGQIRGKTRRMWLVPMLLAIAQIITVTFSIRNGDQIRGDGCSVVDYKFLTYVMAGWTFFGIVAFYEEFAHRGTVRLQHSPIA